MSGSTEQLSRKISGAKDLGGVVRAMKALAASSIGQYQNAVEALDDYLQTVELGLTACLKNSGQWLPADDARPRRAQPIGAVIFGSDQGLVGSFNEVIVEYSLRALRALPGKVAHIWVVGERAKTLLAESSSGSVSGLQVPGSIDAITPLVGQILLEIEAAREKGDVWEIQVFHNHPQNSAGYEPVGRRLLPLDRSWQQKLHAAPWPSKTAPQVIDDIPSAFAAFIQDYLLYFYSRPLLDRWRVRTPVASHRCSVLKKASTEWLMTLLVSSIACDRKASTKNSSMSLPVTKH